MHYYKTFHSHSFSIMTKLEALIAWARLQGASLDHRIKVELSLLGGLGIIATQDIPEDSIVLRVPQSSTYDIQTLLEYTEELKKQNEDVSKVINGVLTLISSPTETTVIRGYIWSFSILQSMGVSMDLIKPYMDILLSTEIFDVEEDLELSDSFVQWQINQKKRVIAEHTDIVRAHPELAQHLSPKDAFRLHQAVKSRVLEIPHALEGGEKYQFTTRVTLVPMLDFANHARDNNAVFDVDKETKEVILRVTRDVSKSTEICICYSPSNDMGMFFRTYGFIPSVGEYEWVLPNFNEIVNCTKNTENEDYLRMAKWLRVTPKVTLHASKEDVKVDLTESRLPLLMIPGLTYYAGWRNEKADIEEDEQDIEELIVEEEENGVILSTETAYGVVYEDAYVSVPNILEQTWEDSENGIRELVKLTIPLLTRAAEASKSADTTTLAATAIQHDTQQMRNYFRVKHELLTHLLEHSTRDFIDMISHLQ